MELGDIKSNFWKSSYLNRHAVSSTRFTDLPVTDIFIRSEEQIQPV